MDMIDQEIMRIKGRTDDLKNRIIPDFEHKTEALYARIIPLEKGHPERDKLEAEYTRLSKELRLRSDELINSRQEIENLELQKKMRR